MSSFSAVGIEKKTVYVFVHGISGVEEMMASTSSAIDVSEKDASLQVLTSIVRGIDEESQVQLEPFISEIEAHVYDLLREIPQKKLKQRGEKGLIGTAIYDTFLTFQPRTGIRVPLTLIAEELGTYFSLVSNNWRALLDIRVGLDRSRLHRVGRAESDTTKVVNNVGQMIHNAVIEKPEGLEEWFNTVENEAKSLINRGDGEFMMEYPPDVIAAAAVWGAIKSMSKPFVQLAKRDAAMTCSMSQQILGMAWNQVFKKGEL